MLHAAPAGLTGLRERLRALGVTREYLRSMTERGDDLRHPLTATRVARLLDDPAALAVRLLFCGEPMSRLQVEEALGAEAAGAAIGRGFLIAEEELTRSPFHLRFVCGLLLASDYLNDEDRDAVMGAGETTGLLYKAADHGQPDRVLDLGCGAGTIALLLAGRADAVVGTDVNARAVALAQFNAVVNGIANAEFRTGSLFEPLQGEQFDPIVSQPPYYPAPASTAAQLTYLHGGRRGDELANRILDELPEHLAAGGRALIFTSWPADHARCAPTGMSVLELTTNQRELHGTRQSLNVLEHGREVWKTFEVPADDWPAVRPWRIDQLIATQKLLEASEETLSKARLEYPLPPSILQEGDQMLLRFPPEVLLGTVPVDSAMVPENSSMRRQMLARGLLTPASSE